MSIMCKRWAFGDKGDLGNEKYFPTYSRPSASFEKAVSEQYPGVLRYGERNPDIRERG